MNIRLAGIGIWTKGLTHFQQLVDGLTADTNAVYTIPAPAAIPARERRRAGHFISLAVEVAHQACDMAGIDKTLVPSVFASAIGDTEITDYMCRKLTQPEKLLSPTQFHNSVHNAASGYWSISAGNHAPSTFVGGFDRSFGAGLFEAMSQVLAFRTPVLLVGYDTATRPPFQQMLQIDDAAGVALVLAPVDSVQSGFPGPSLDMSIEFAPAHATGSPAQSTHPMQAGLDIAHASAALLRGERGIDKHTDALQIDVPRSGQLRVGLQLRAQR